MNSLTQNDGIIFLGGLFQDKTSFRSLLYYCFQILLARLLQTKVVFYAVGIGPLQRKISRFLFNSAINSVNLLTLRDESSAQLTPYKQNAAVTCDPVWSIEGDFSFQNKIPSINWQSYIVGVSLKRDKNLKEYHLTFLAEKLSKALSDMKDWQLVLIPCMPQEDLPVLFELYSLITRKIGTSNRIFIVDNFSEFPIAQQAGILASCDVMVGMRYHALLVPLTNGKPVFGLVYDQKVKSLLDFTSQVSVTFRDSFEQPWNYFWQNLERSANIAKEASIRANQLHKINIELLNTVFNT